MNKQIEFYAGQVLRMLTWIRIVEIVLLGATSGAGMMVDGSYEITTCEEFERGARFNPYEIVDSMWKIFYFWANTTEMYPIVFSLPGKKRMDNLKMLVDAVDPELGVEWDKATLLMEPRPGVMMVFLYGGTPGAFRALVKQDRRTNVRPFPLPLIKFADVRLKMLDRYIGMMCCEDLTAYALARMDDMPLTDEECEKAAAKFDIKQAKAHSYLYVKRLADEL